jgi:murein DD-endopeptidase MepM/ murein hydrolase activator NlpD
MDHLNTGDADALFALFNRQMRAAVPLAELRTFLSRAREAKGRIQRARAAAPTPAATYVLSAEHGEWLLAMQWDAQGEIAQMTLTEPPRPPPPVATNTTPLALPFRGRWFVVWGGGDERTNAQHIGNPSQRRAADLVMVGSSGRTFRTDGKRNSDYFAYGQEILAVADGEVITAIDGVADNSPGSQNAYVAPGNLVILRHAPQLFSVYAHLQPRSLRVREGVRVKRGQVLGLCGNSGNSSEPHLHFQLQDGPLFESAWGTEAVFSRVSLTRAKANSTVSNYRFQKGDTIAPPQ